MFNVPPLLFRTVGLLFAFVLASSAIAQQRKFIIIGIDGCLPEALQMAVTPVMDGLIANATYSYDATTKFPTYSGPGWSSALTGVWGEKHQVIDNSFVGNNLDTYPHFFNHVKQYYPDGYLASVCQWSPINDEIVTAADNIINVFDGPSVTTAALEEIAVDSLLGLFLHYDDVDLTGHTYSFSVDEPTYLESIEDMDAEVGTLMNALMQRPNYAEEEWLVVLCTDHGAQPDGHGGGSYEERNIFIVFSGDNFPNEEIQAEYEPWDTGTSNALNINANNVYGVIDHEVYDFEENEDFTIELRYKTNGWEGDPPIISDKDWSSGYNPGFVIACQDDLQTWKFNLGDDDQRIDLEGGAINDGEWHHLAVSCDRDGTTFLFQDGQMVSATNNFLTGSIISDLPIAVGQDGTLEYPFDSEGWIDELRIWNVALSTELLEEWSCTDLAVEHPNYDQLIGFWKMEEVADIVIDGTDPNNQVDMDLINGPYVSTENPMVCQALVNELPEIVDIVPTIMTHLCVEVDPEWMWDGQIWGITLEDCVGSTGGPDLSDISIFPNPTNGSISIQGNLQFTPSEMAVFDAQGKVVRLFSPGTDYLNIELNLPAGLYTLHIWSAEGNVYRKKIVVNP